MTTIVHTQAELDTALDADSPNIVIDSPAGVWLTLSRGRVAVRGVSRVGPVGGSATITDVGGSATIRNVWGSATITDVGGSATIIDVGGSATITGVGDSATIIDVGDSATIIDVGGSATITGVGGSATIIDVWDSATIRNVWGSATIRNVWGSATVSLHGKATATNVAPYVAVHLHSTRATTDGGVVIDVSALNLTAATDWCEYHGVKVSKAGVATVYKAVSDDYTSPRGVSYKPGTKPSADDWTDDNDCGGGLHFSPTPFQAQFYHRDATRFLAVGVKVADMRPILGGVAKCKAPRVVRACVEVDLDGKVQR